MTDRLLHSHQQPANCLWIGAWEAYQLCTISYWSYSDFLNPALPLSSHIVTKVKSPPPSERDVIYGRSLKTDYVKIIVSQEFGSWLCWPIWNTINSHSRDSASCLFHISQHCTQLNVITRNSRPQRDSTRPYIQAYQFYDKKHPSHCSSRFELH